MNIAEILLLKYPDQIKNGQIILQDDGQGIYIKKWQMGSIAKPTDAEVQAMATDSIVLANQAITNRINAVDGYKPWQDQLEMLFNDLRNGTQTFAQHIIDVKNKYLKPGESTITDTVTAPVVVKRNSPTAVVREILITSFSGTQAIAGINKVTVNFATKSADSNSAFVNNNTYTAITGGIYEVGVFMQTNNASVTVANAYQWQLYITIAGSVSSSQMIDTYTHGLASTAVGSLKGNVMISLAKNDTVSIQVQKTNSTSLNILSGYLQIKKISEA